MTETTPPDPLVLPPDEFAAVQTVAAMLGFPETREPLGRAAFGAHVSGLAEQEQPPWQDKPPAWEELGDGDREFYMRIGHAVANYALTENAATYGISCSSCAAHLDRANAERERAERAEAKLAAIAEHCRDRMRMPGRSGMSLGAATVILGIIGSEEVCPGGC